MVVTVTDGIIPHSGQNTRESQRGFDRLPGTAGTMVSGRVKHPALSTSADGATIARSPVDMKSIHILFTFQMIFCLAFSSAAKNRLIALMPAGTPFRQVLEGIWEELDTSNYTIDTITMSKSLKTEKLARQCRKTDVNALILMDGKAISAAGDLQKFDPFFVSLPKFVYMTLQVESTTGKLSNVAGIKFEVPVYTLVTNFRIISRKDISRVGVFHRKSFTSSIERAKELLKKEQISLQTVCVDCEKKEATTVKDALKTMKQNFGKMIRRQRSEVFLVLADNLVVNNTSLSEFWIRKVKNRKIPVIASLDILASPKIGLAVFTADPDLLQLGIQAANQIMEYFENGTTIEEIGFEPVISIKSTLNEAVARELDWKLKTEKLGRIDKIIKNSGSGLQ